MVDIATDAILFTTYYGGEAPAERDEIHIDTANVPELSEETPCFRDFAISDIVCRGAQKAISIFGLPELSIKNVRFNTLTMHTKKGIECLYADSICFNTLQLNTDDDIMITLNNCQFVTINEFNEGVVKNEHIHVMGEISDNIVVNTKKMK